MSYPHQLTNEEHIAGYDDRHLKPREDDAEAAYATGAPKKGLTRKSWIIISVIALVVVVAAAVGGGVAGSKKSGSPAAASSAASSDVPERSSTSSAEPSSQTVLDPLAVVSFTLTVPTTTVTSGASRSTLFSLIRTSATFQPRLSEVTLSGSTSGPPGLDQSVLFTVTQDVSVYDATVTVPNVANLSPAPTALTAVHLTGPVTILATISSSTSSNSFTHSTTSSAVASTASPGFVASSGGAIDGSAVGAILTGKHHNRVYKHLDVSAKVGQAGAQGDRVKSSLISEL